MGAAGMEEREQLAYQLEFGAWPGDFKRYFVRKRRISSSICRDAAADLQQSPEEHHQQPGHDLSRSAARPLQPALHVSQQLVPLAVRTAREAHEL